MNELEGGGFLAPLDEPLTYTGKGFMEKTNLTINEEYISLRQMSDLMPHLFPKNRLNYLLRNRHKNGFKDCLVRIGDKFYIKLSSIQEWIDHEKD